MNAWSDERFLYANGIAAPEREQREYFDAVNAADLKIADAVIASLKADDMRVPAAPDEAAAYYRERGLEVLGEDDGDYAVPLMDYRELDLDWQERCGEVNRLEADLHDTQAALKAAKRAAAESAERADDKGDTILLLCGLLVMAVMWGWSR